MSRFLVTGAAGFIGSHLSATLVRSGHHVVGVDNLDPFYEPRIKLDNVAQLPSEHFRLHRIDIRDTNAMRNLLADTQPDAVIHLAALAGVRPSVKDPTRYVSVNIEGLLSLLDACRAAHCNHVLFASSSSVYGAADKVPFSENDTLLPISPYGVTKRAGELICQSYSRIHRMTIGVVRYFTVYGPGQRPDLAIHRFFRFLAAGRPLPVFGDGSTSRDYTYIDDIVAGTVAALHRVLEHDHRWFRIWNLGGATPVSLRDLIHTMEHVAGCTACIDHQPEQSGDVVRTYADIARSQSELQYTPATRLADGLAEQWAWMDEQRLLEHDNPVVDVSSIEPANLPM